MKFEKEYKHFDNYYSNFTDVVSIINKDGYLVFMNFTEIGKIEDYIGKHFEELNNHREKSVNDKIYELIENGIPFTSEYNIEYQGINSTFLSNNFRINVENLGDFVVSITKEVSRYTPQNEQVDKFELLLQNQDFIVIKFKYENGKFIITDTNDFTYQSIHRNINQTLKSTDLQSLFYEIDINFVINHLKQKDNHLNNYNQTYIRQIDGSIFRSEIIISVCNDNNKNKIDEIIKNGFSNVNEVENFEFQIIAHDTNLRNQLKNELVENHFKLSEVVLNIGKLICITNEENQIIFTNDLFCNYFDYEFTKNSFFEPIEYFSKNNKLIFSYQNQNGFNKQSKIENNGTDITTTQDIYEFEITNPKNSVKYIEVKKQKIDFNNLPNCNIILLNDITSAKENFIGHKEKNRFKELMDSMPLMIHSLNENNEIIEVSNYWLSKLGYSYEEVIGKHSYDFMTEKSRIFALSNIVPDYYSNESLNNIPYTFVSKSGAHFDVLMTVVILKDELNNKRSLSISFDVTEKNNLLKQIQQNEALLNTIFENAPYGIELLNTQGDKLKVNKKTLEIAEDFGYEMKYLASENELIAIMGIMPNFINAISGKKQFIKNLKIDFGPLSNKKDIVPKDDLIGTYDMYLTPIVNSKNEVENVVCFVDDKTQFQKYQQQLEFQSLILNNINDIVVALDENLKIIYWNDIATKTYGFNADETIGNRIEDFYSYRWIDDNDTQKSLRSVREKGYWKGEIMHITQSGKELYIETNTTNILDNNGNFKGVLAVNRDITFRKEQEFALIRNKNLTDTIFDNSPTAIQVFDSKGYSIRMNEANMKYVGLSDKMVGIGDYNVLQDEQLKHIGIGKYFEKAYRGEIVEMHSIAINFEMYEDIWQTHYKKRFIDLSILPLLDENNEIDSVVSFITDITERFLYQQKIVESEAQFRLLTENSTDLIINYDKNGNITYVSPSVKRLLGVNIDEILNTKYSQWFNSQNITKYGTSSNIQLNNLFNNVNLNELVNVEYKIKNKNGNFIYLDTLIRPILNEIGELINVITYSRDITERVAQETKLKEAIRLMNAMSEIANIGAWELDVSNNHITWSDQIYKIHNLEIGDNQELENALSFYVEESKDILQESVLKAINENIPYDLVLKFKDAKSNLKWVRTTCLPIIENERVIKIYGTLQDITEKYEKDKKIKDNESLLNSINSNISEALYRSTPNRGIIYANNATLKMFGFESLDEMNQFGTLNYYPEKREEIKRNLSEFGYVKKIENLYRKKDGSTFWGLNSSFQNLDENGEIIYDGAIVDITELKEKEELLNNLNQNLELMVEERTNELRLTQEKLFDSFIQEKEYLELKSKFITLVSHEYRTPLTIIQTSLYLLEKFYEKGKTEQFQNQISKINDAIESMTVLLDNVLKLGTYDLSAVKKYLQEIDVIKLITEIIEMQLQIHKNTVTINFDCSFEHIIMMTDKTMIYQIINNLIENSIKYSNENKNIEITVDLINYNEFSGNPNLISQNNSSDLNKPKDANIKYLKIIIKDYGIGISKENIGKISEPFYRGDNVSEIRGLGIGLSISKTWVTILEGSLVFESEVGKYTIATLELPINYKQDF